MKSLKFSILLLGFLFIFETVNLIAEDTIPVNDNIVNQDTSQPVQKELTKSPIGAIWRTFVLPGWGQLYVENYWKAPIFFVGAGACVYLIIWNNDKYEQYQAEYDLLKSTTPNDRASLDLLNRQKEFYRDNRDRSYFFLGVTYLIAAVDAYVGAYLFDFDVDDNIGLRISPYYNINMNYGLTLSLKLK